MWSTSPLRSTARPLDDACPGLCGEQLDRTRSAAERSFQSHLRARLDQQSRQSREPPKQLGALIYPHRSAGHRRAEGGVNGRVTPCEEMRKNTAWLIGILLLALSSNAPRALKFNRHNAVFRAARLRQ